MKHPTRLALLAIAAATTAFARFDPSSDPNSDLALTAKFRRYDAAGGTWIETSRARPGEELQLWLYARTDYYTGAAQVGFAFDKGFFAFGNHAEGESLESLATVNADYLDGAAGLQSYQPDWWPSGDRRLKRAIQRGVITQDDTNRCGFVSGAVGYSNSSRNAIYEDDDADTDWLVKFTGITVRTNDYVRTAGRIGEVTFPEGLLTCESANGLFSFPKGPDEVGYPHDPDDLIVSGNGWNADCSSTPARWGSPPKTDCIC